MNQAKSMLGTSLLEVDNGFPGPDRYMLNSMHSVPGFKIKPSNHAAKRSETDLKKMQNMRDLGPHSYKPVNPALKRTNHIRKNTIGNSKR